MTDIFLQLSEKEYRELQRMIATLETLNAATVVRAALALYDTHLKAIACNAEIMTQNEDGTFVPLTNDIAAATSPLGGNHTIRLKIQGMTKQRLSNMTQKNGIAERADVIRSALTLFSAYLRAVEHRRRCVIRQRDGSLRDMIIKP